MKASMILATATLFFASAVTAILTCGVSCISSAASAAGRGNGGYRCRCSSSSVIQASAQGCVIGNCGIATALQVQASGEAVNSYVATATSKLY